MFAKRAGLTPQRVDMLLMLRRTSMRQKDLADILCVTRPVVSRMVAALEDLGYVTRTQGTRDRRERFTAITDEGRTQLALCFPKPTTIGAQDHGEIQWLRWWREHIAKLGIRVDSILRSRQPSHFDVFATKHECHPELFWSSTLPLWLWDPHA